MLELPIFDFCFEIQKIVCSDIRNRIKLYINNAFKHISLFLYSLTNSYFCDMKEDVILTQEEADRLIAVPKSVTNNKERISVFELDLSKSSDFRLALCSSDSIDRATEFLLRIRVSEKMRTKISLHTQERKFQYCLFRVDFNGGGHTNPDFVNEYVPSKLKPFAGKILGGNHVHYHVQDYPSAAWAIPVDEDAFPVKKFDFNEYHSELKDIVSAVSDFIHLETKIIITGNLIYDGMD